ncbi:hypothetical protein KAI87_10730, partial [Myxococcota bacterium]|nr:hypothetical protein [Myxococcota bacterium]
DGGGVFTTAGTEVTPYRNALFSWDERDGNVLWAVGLDRLNLRYKKKSLMVKLGRFPVNYSVTSIFAPNDFFAPFSPAAINKIYKPGVDAAQFSYQLGPMTTLELTGVMGADDKDVDFENTALMARFGTVFMGYELGLMGGKLAERMVGAVSAQGQMGLVGVRAEGHYGISDRDADFKRDDGVDDHYRGAIGFDYMNVWHNTSVSFEYMYRSDGEPEPIDYLNSYDRLFPDDLAYGGQHYAAMALGGEILPILRLGFFAYANLNDASGLGGLSLIYSASDEVEMMLGSYLPFGEKNKTLTADPFFEMKSEYGSMPQMLYGEVRAYF